MKTKQPRVSADEVRKALEKFKSSGGLIQRLPDQPSPKRRMVGGKWAMYETVLEGMQVAPAAE